MKIKDLQLKPCVSVDKNESILSIAKKVKETGVRNVLISDEGVLKGIISITDLISKGFGQDERKFEDIRAEDIMTMPVFVVHEEDDVHIALVAMMKKGLTSCPVVNEEEKCKGVVTINQLIESDEQS